MLSLKDLLSNTCLDKVDAKVLLGYLCETELGWPKSALVSRDQEDLPDTFVAQWKLYEARRINGEPIAYIIGHKGFHEIDLYVAPGVLIPRPETELLVDLCIKHIQSITDKNVIKILDLGTGSGAIALAIAHHLKRSSSLSFQITATDVSDDALQIARNNANRLGLSASVNFVNSSWFDAIPHDQLFDVIVSNPPYIAANDPHLSQGDLRFEPSQALTDFADGLSAYRAILNGAQVHLVSGGLLAFEHGYDQAAELQILFEQHGFLNIKNIKDYAGLDRISYGVARHTQSR